MIYQIGRLVVGDNWKDIKKWGKYITKNCYTGVLFYKPEERTLYFFEARHSGERKTFVFNIDTTHFELVKRGKIDHYFLISIIDKENNQYLFTSDISFYGRTQNDRVYAMSKQMVYNQSIITVINHLRKKKSFK